MKANKIIGLWLLCGVIMIYIQIILGGITRLTGSGLSITKWEIITGTLPPLNTEDWQNEFEKYKATPQYQMINEGMSLSQFKTIYFWEYMHRLWARIMGFVFFIPFVIFLLRKQVDAALLKKLITIIVLSSLVASFGWIMVKSGLIDRPWVSPYKLTLHLMLAIITYVYVLWVALLQLFPGTKMPNSGLRKLVVSIILLLFIQLTLGGMMSGMKAAIFYPTFPDMNGSLIPEVLLSLENWSLDAFKHYYQYPFPIAFVQFFHRLFAYFIVVAAIYFVWKTLHRLHPRSVKISSLLLMGAVIIQFALGILTVIHSLGSVPVILGVLHQAGAILLVTTAVLVYYFITYQSFPERPL